MLQLILGLGNIGKKYVGTRHNVGFEVVNRLAEKLKVYWQPREKEYDWVQIMVGETEVILAKPRTYMNLSGLAAKKLLETHNLSPQQMLVIVDDLALPLGAVRIRSKGSDGGHNGLMSIIEEFGTQAFPRVRLGIGSTLGIGVRDLGLESGSAPPPDEQLPPKPVDKEADIIDFVLGKFGPDERPVVDKMVAHAADAVLFAIDHRLDETMSKYNYNPALPHSL